MSQVKIGLEIHAQITELESKLFCSCRGNYRGRDLIQTFVKHVVDFRVLYQLLIKRR